MNVPTPTPIFRLVHVANLELLITRRGLHAPNSQPNDGREYRAIHNVDIQRERQSRTIPRGPGGVIHDYVSFYFGPRSPMLFNLHTGRVATYNEGQQPLIYLTSTVERVVASGVPFVFSDGHGIAGFTEWFDNVSELRKVDWDAVYARMWRDTIEDMDLQRRKQAEFLVHEFCSWDLIEGVGVLNQQSKSTVEQLLLAGPADAIRPVEIKRDWYY